MGMEPTQEQFAEWLNTAVRGDMPNRKWSPAKPGTLAADVSCLAYSAGADAELEACCDAIYEHEGRPFCGGTAEWLLAKRRPKPPSFTPQALAELNHLACQASTDCDMIESVNCITRALESLPGD